MAANCTKVVRKEGRAMCEGASRWNSSSSPGYSTKWRRRCRVRVRHDKKVHGGAEQGKDIEFQNLKLYLRNCCINEENQRLRRKALLLGEENRALLSELRRKLSHEISEIQPVF